LDTIFEQLHPQYTRLVLYTHLAQG
jgi:hypothetical protein